MKFSLLAGLFIVFFHSSALAQFPYSESFKNTTSPGLVVSGSAKLTAATGTDPVGDGYLRLTDNTTNSVGYVYAHDSFPSNYGLTASFEFFSWKPGANTTNQADGMTFFLFDASVNAFRPGGSGGSLGYAQYYSTPGMAKGYIGISIDEFGNFSSASDGTKNGGPGQQRGSVAIRGPGNGKTSSDYVYQTGVIASDAAYNAGFQSFGQRYPDATNPNYRKMKITMTPGSSAGANIGYKITIIMYKGGSSLTAVTLINNFDYPFAAPARLQFGLAASTGAITNYHEIRNLTIDVANTGALVLPTSSADAGIVACQGQHAIVDVTANDHSNNTGGAINKETVDLDPITAGRQTSYTDPGKGSYSVDDNGVVSFTALAGYSGSSSASYTVDDTYGMTSAAATISFSVSSNSAPALTISNPPAACFPSVVDITNASWKMVTTPGSTYSYFASLTDANNNLNAITGTALSLEGTYYIRASLNGCATVKPIEVSVSYAPTVSNAGSDQNFCSSTGAQSTTLLANNPDIGTGAWTQVSGPSTATITYPDAATSPVSNMAKGVYLFRWTVVNGACAASMDDIQVSVGIASSAGSNQSVANASSLGLSANAATPGTGLWSLVSGPSVSFANTADPSTTVSGLTTGNTYVLSWKITNGGCSSTTQVSISNVLNTIANAGPDRTVLSIAPFALAGNNPGTGNTGTWTMISKPTGSLAAILFPNSPTATVSAVALAGDYVFRWTMANGSFSNFDDVVIHVGTPLPVRLISFSGKLENSKAVLSWKTATESNNDHFVVERSADGRQFTSLGSVAGAGNSAAVHSYSWTDPLSSFNSPVVYYRLKQVDQDGAFTYSQIIRLWREAHGGMEVTTNPFNNSIQGSIYAAQACMAEIKLYDKTGRLVASRQQSLTTGSNQLLVDHLQSLPSGIYVLTIKSNLDEEKVKLIKQ